VDVGKAARELARVGGVGVRMLGVLALTAHIWMRSIS
jgi:hypothetical protein